MTLKEGAVARRPPNTKNRPLWEDLEEIRTQPNETGALDWAYLSMHTNFPDHRLDRTISRRIYVDLGLRRADGPDKAKITPRSKLFVPEMDLTQPLASAKADFSGVERALPATLEVTARSFGLAGSVGKLSKDPPCLTGPEQGKAGQAHLVQLKLENKGDQPIVGKLRLSRAPSMVFPRPMWPSGEDSGDFAVGFSEIASTKNVSDQWPPRLGLFPYQWVCWLMVNPDGQAGQARTINEGYKTIGGVEREVKLAGRSVQVLPLLFISVSSPDAKAAEPAMPDMEQIVEKLRPELQKALGVPAVKPTPRPRTTSPRRPEARDGQGT